MNLPKKNNQKVIKGNQSNSTDYKEELKSIVSTSPLIYGGASFKTNVLIESSSSKLVYKPTIGTAIFCFIFLAVGLGVLYFNTIHLFNADSSIKNFNWFLIIFGLIFSTAGGVMFYKFYKPRVFDKQLGIYYKAYRPNISYNRNSINVIPLKSISALQIIGEHVKSDKGSYKSFELNLVLSDGSRKNVVDHGNLKSIINDAEILSSFLNIPIWHAGSADV